MKDRTLHIISFTVPYPVTYGGVYDVYYKMVSLKKAGIIIFLHCFGEPGNSYDHLLTIAEQVFYYPRHTGLAGVSLTIPYIVKSRSDENLAIKLLQDDHPILLEGIHCTFLLNDKRFSGRKIILRLHNTEHRYYRQLYSVSTDLSRKIYFLAESILLKRYEKQAARKASLIIAVSNSDVEAYDHDFNIRNVRFLPVFTGFDEVNIPEGMADYCLYHGNLSVDENEKAAEWLMKEVFSESKIPFIIAGRAPSEKLLRLAAGYEHITIVPDPSEKQMQDLVRGAQCHVLPSLNITGVKLKLINALFNGRHCIVNQQGASGSRLEPLCTLAQDANSFRNEVSRLFTIPLSTESIKERKLLLEKLFDEEMNCRLLIQWIW